MYARNYALAIASASCPTESTLKDYIMEWYQGIILWNHITELHEGIILQNYIRESYDEFTFWKYIAELDYGDIMADIVRQVYHSRYISADILQQIY